MAILAKAPKQIAKKEKKREEIKKFKNVSSI